MKRLFLFLVTSIFLMFLCSLNVFAEEVTSYVSEYLEDQNISNSIVDANNVNALNIVTADNGNGTYTSSFFHSNVKFVDENGSVVEKDLSLIDVTDFNMISEGYSLTVAANDIKTYYPDSFAENGIKVDDLEFNIASSDAMLSNSSEGGAYYEDVINGVDFKCYPKLTGCLILYRCQVIPVHV